MNHFEESDGASSLVRLQVADEVPAKRGVLSLQFRDLPFGLLHAVLAEVSEARGGGFTDETRRVRLADGDECDFARVAVGARRARLDATVHALDARTQTRLLRPGFGTHYCDSVVNGVDYNKRARASATASSASVLSRCVQVSYFRHTKRRGARAVWCVRRGNFLIRGCFSGASRRSTVARRLLIIRVSSVVLPAECCESGRRKSGG